MCKTFFSLARPRSSGLRLAAPARAYILRLPIASRRNPQAAPTTVLASDQPRNRLLPYVVLFHRCQVLLCTLQLSQRRLRVARLPFSSTGGEPAPHTNHPDAQPPLRLPRPAADPVSPGFRPLCAGLADCLPRHAFVAMPSRTTLLVAIAGASPYRIISKGVFPTGSPPQAGIS